MPLERTEVRHPDQSGRFVDDDVGTGLAGICLGVVPAGEPFRGMLAQFLVPEALALRSVGVAVHVEGASGEVRQEHQGYLRRAPQQLPSCHRFLAGTAGEQHLQRQGRPGWRQVGAPY